MSGSDVKIAPFTGRCFVYVYSGMAFFDSAKKLIGYFGSASEGEENAKEVLGMLQKCLKESKNEDERLSRELDEIEKTHITEENRLITAEMMVKLSTAIAAAKRNNERYMEEADRSWDKDQDKAVVASMYYKTKDWIKGNEMSTLLCSNIS